MIIYISNNQNKQQPKKEDMMVLTTGNGADKYLKGGDVTLIWLRVILQQDRNGT
jgi:hypothetical protein